MLRLRWILLLSVAMLLGDSPHLQADTIFLTDGRKLEGDIISQNNKSLKVKVSGQIIELSKDEIREFRYSRSKKGNKKLKKKRKNRKKRFKLNKVSIKRLTAAYSRGTTRFSSLANRSLKSLFRLSSALNAMHANQTATQTTASSSQVGRLIYIEKNNAFNIKLHQTRQSWSLTSASKNERQLRAALLSQPESIENNFRLTLGRVFAGRGMEIGARLGFATYNSTSTGTIQSSNAIDELLPVTPARDPTSGSPASGSSALSGRTIFFSGFSDRFKSYIYTEGPALEFNFSKPVQKFRIEVSLEASVQQGKWTLSAQGFSVVDNSLLISPDYYSSKYEIDIYDLKISPLVAYRLGGVELFSKLEYNLAKLDIKQLDLGSHFPAAIPESLLLHQNILKRYFTAEKRDYLWLFGLRSSLKL